MIWKAWRVDFDFHIYHEDCLLTRNQGPGSSKTQRGVSNTVFYKLVACGLLFYCWLVIGCYCECLFSLVGLSSISNCSLNVLLLHTNVLTFFITILTLCLSCSLYCQFSFRWIQIRQYNICCHNIRMVSIVLNSNILSYIWCLPSCINESSCLQFNSSLFTWSIIAAPDKQRVF